MCTSLDTAGSLFIDEGFGSLASETLDIAIASLDILQALGRNVGVILHVPILVERIGAKKLILKWIVVECTSREYMLSRTR